MQIIWVATLPGTFLLNGAGQLWLYRFRTAEGGFYERLINFESDWIGAHLLLWAGTILLIPACLVIWKMVRGKKGSTLADIALIIVMITSFFLAGQYTIDFIMPSIAKAGGEALIVHQGLFENPLTNIMFYELPELTAIGLLLLTISLVWSGSVSRNHAILFFALWIVLIVGSIADYVFIARLALLLLGVAFLPVAKKALKA